MAWFKRARTQSPAPRVENLRSNITTQSVAQAAVILFTGTLLSRILGFMREMVIAHLFGATAETDAFLIAFVVPGIFSGIIGGAIAAAFIPVFTEYRIKYGEQDAWQMASTVINVVVIVLILGSIVTGVAAPLIIRILGPGLAEETRILAVQLTKVMSVAVFLTGLTGLSTAILNSYMHFVFPAFAGLLYNVGIIGSAFLLTNRFGVTSLAVGVVVGALWQLLAQSLILKSKRYYYTPSFYLNHPGVKQLFFLVLPFLVGSAVGELNLIVDRILASGLAEGSISALNFGSRVMELPPGLFAATIGTAVYPALSQKVAEGRLDRLRDTLSEGLRMLWFITLPAAVGLIVLREPIIRLLFERGAFDPLATRMTAIALLYYSLGLFAHAANIVLTRAFFSMQDVKTPVKLGALSVIVNIALNLLLIRYLAHGGLALATSIAAGVNFVLLTYYLRKRLGNLDGQRIARSVTKILLASVVMGAICWIGSKMTERFFSDVGELKYQILQVGSLVIIGALTYLLMAVLLKMEELNKIVSLKHIFRTWH